MKVSWLRQWLQIVSESHSVIVNTLRKLESAGIIESRSLE